MPREVNKAQIEALLCRLLQPRRSLERVASGEYWQECLALVSNAFYIYLDLFCLVNLHKFKEIFELNKYSGKCGFVNFELKTSEFTEITVSKSAMHS